FSFDSNPQHCGGCFVSCPSAPFASATCDQRHCGFRCDVLRADCDGLAENGCEADLARSESCGSCLEICPPARRLCSVIEGQPTCVSECSETLTSCGNVCADLETSLSHCGGCDHSCPDPGPGTPACIDRVCQPTCEPMHHACSGVCVSDLLV